MLELATCWAPCIALESQCHLIQLELSFRPPASTCTDTASPAALDFLTILVAMPKADKGLPSTSSAARFVRRAAHIFSSHPSSQSTSPDTDGNLACACYKCVKKKSISIPRRTWYYHAKYRKVTVNGEYRAPGLLPTPLEEPTAHSAATEDIVVCSEVFYYCFVLILL